MNAQLSDINKLAIYELSLMPLADTKLKFSFNTYSYDPAAKMYFKMFHTGGIDLNAQMLKNDGEYVIGIASDASVEVQSPRNFAFSLGALPAEQKTEQKLYIATSVHNKTTLSWGIPMK